MNPLCLREPLICTSYLLSLQGSICPALSSTIRLCTHSQGTFLPLCSLPYTSLTSAHCFPSPSDPMRGCPPLSGHVLCLGKVLPPSAVKYMCVDISFPLLRLGD